MHTHNRFHLPPLVKPLLIGISVGVVGSTLCLLLFALLLYKLALPVLATPLAVAALGLGGFAGGFAAGVAGRQRGLLIGAVCGTGLYLILLTAGLIRADGIALGYAALKWAVATVCAAAGGILGVNRRHS